MGKYLKISYLLIFFLCLTGCSVQEPAVEKDITENIVPESTPEETVEPEAEAEPQNVIPSVTDEVVDAQESPIETAEEGTIIEEPTPSVVEPEQVVGGDDMGIEEDNTSATEEVTEIPEEVDASVTDDMNLTEPEDTNMTQELPLPAEEIISPEGFEPITQQIGVLKVEIAAETVSIRMNDPVVKYFSLSDPDRIVIDFKDIRYFEPKEVSILSPYVNKIATAAHDNYNRVVIYLNEKLEYTILKESGGWLIRFKK